MKQLEISNFELDFPRMLCKHSVCDRHWLQFWEEKNLYSHRVQGRRTENKQILVPFSNISSHLSLRNYKISED